MPLVPAVERTAADVRSPAASGARASRLFLLSPANCSGTRAHQVASLRARFALAERLRTDEGVPLGELFAFVSGLYFRGKLTYARRFAVPPDPPRPAVGGAVHVITPNAGLWRPEDRVTLATMRDFAGTDVRPDNPAYRQPLERSAAALAVEAGPASDVVLLGSIASPKYVDVLLAIFGTRLLFPVEFVGRGDMSRGGLLLRRAAAGAELEYVPVAGAVRRGARPPKLPPLARAGQRSRDGGPIKAI
jgi:hypothetical protein